MKGRREEQGEIERGEKEERKHGEGEWTKTSHCRLSFSRSKGGEGEREAYLIVFFIFSFLRSLHHFHHPTLSPFHYSFFIHRDLP
ncbi:hypothetical protein IE53DRAFT_34169 [Violaceomyces palustris]|uniref:Uncharacterized protein n=1 Tax=Violaceomyces palustris TaxID=1673888 RepID=A0ACD0P173_9BASI|nr:hypothetical protein IE53DRAFT_34169 [Violaceomyces palustris]